MLRRHATCCPGVSRCGVIAGHSSPNCRIVSKAPCGGWWTDGICAAGGANGTVAYNREFAATVNTPDEADLAARVIERSFGADQLVPEAAPLMASEDFGFVLHHRPGAYVLIGNGTDGPSGQSLHSPDYDFNDEILSVGVAFWTALDQSYLSA